MQMDLEGVQTPDKSTVGKALILLSRPHAEAQEQLQMLFPEFYSMTDSFATSSRGGSPRRATTSASLSVLRFVMRRLKAIGERVPAPSRRSAAKPAAPPRRPPRSYRELKRYIAKEQRLQTRKEKTDNHLNSVWLPFNRLCLSQVPQRMFDLLAFSLTNTTISANRAGISAPTSTLVAHKQPAMKTINTIPGLPLHCARKRQKNVFRGQTLIQWLLFYQIVALPPTADTSDPDAAKRLQTKAELIGELLITRGYMHVELEASAFRDKLLQFETHAMKHQRGAANDEEFWTLNVLRQFPIRMGADKRNGNKVVEDLYGRMLGMLARHSQPRGDREEQRWRQLLAAERAKPRERGWERKLVMAALGGGVATVDLDGIHNSDEFFDFGRVAMELQDVALKEMRSNHARHVAFFLNLYCVLSFHASVAFKHLTTAKERKRVASYACYALDNQFFSLDDIEHGVLRANQPPPRPAAALSLLRSHTRRVRFGTTDKNDKRLASSIDPQRLDPRFSLSLHRGYRSGPCRTCPVVPFTAASLERVLAAATSRALVSLVSVQDKTVTMSEFFSYYHHEIKSAPFATDGRARGASRINKVFALSLFLSLFSLLPDLPPCHRRPSAQTPSSSTKKCWAGC
jgi:hypothetical protein